MSHTSGGGGFSSSRPSSGGAWRLRCSSEVTLEAAAAHVVLVNPPWTDKHTRGSDGAVITAVHVAVLVFIIVVGLTRAKPANLRPFAPHGARGVFSGAAYVYFTFTGFDAVATSAEEVGPVPAAQPHLPPGAACGALSSFLPAGLRTAD